MSEKPYRINYSAVSTYRTLDERIRVLEGEIQAAGYVCLTDAIAHFGQSGEMMFELLGREQAELQRTNEDSRWKLKVRCDEWGNPLAPGDYVTRRVKRQYKDRAGRKLKSRAINDMQRRGDYEKTFVKEYKFKVDEKGCIDCQFEDAGWFLTEYGVHFETGSALCGRRELSSGPCKAPDGMRHVHYWRFEESPPWVYDKLPNLTTKRKKKSLSPTSPTEETAAADGGNEDERKRQGSIPVGSGDASNHGDGPN